MSAVEVPLFPNLSRNEVKARVTVADVVDDFVSH
jgi:hypothetical protein